VGGEIRLIPKKQFPGLSEEDLFNKMTYASDIGCIATCHTPVNYSNAELSR